MSERKTIDADKALLHMTFAGRRLLYARGRSMRTGRYISRDSYMGRDDGMGGISHPSDRRY